MDDPIHFQWIMFIHFSGYQHFRKLSIQQTMENMKTTFCRVIIYEWAGVQGKHASLGEAKLLPKKWWRVVGSYPQIAGLIAGEWRWKSFSWFKPCHWSWLWLTRLKQHPSDSSLDSLIYIYIYIYIYICNSYIYIYI